MHRTSTCLIFICQMNDELLKEVWQGSRDLCQIFSLSEGNRYGYCENMQFI